MDRALTAPIWPLSQNTEASTGPDRKPLRAPVFINDVAIPWRDETLLLKLLRDQAADQEE